MASKQTLAPAIGQRFPFVASPAVWIRLPLAVPPLLVAIALLIADTSDPAQLRHVLPQLATGKLVLLGYLAFSCGQAAFPSCGDHVGVLGALAFDRGHRHYRRRDPQQWWASRADRGPPRCVLVAFVPANASALSLLVLGTIARSRRST